MFDFLFCQLILIDKAFNQFETDDSVKVGVLYGEHGTFCAGIVYLLRK